VRSTVQAGSGRSPFFRHHHSPSVKTLYASHDTARLAELKTILSREGIQSFVTLSQSSSLIVPPGPLAFTQLTPEISIACDEDMTRAAEILRSWLDASSARVATWQCSKCGETLEEQFDTCWQCGTKR
jgi:hypothetical protein